MTNIWAFIKRILKSEYLALVLRLFIGFYFIYASMSKIPYPAQFAALMGEYRIFPHWAIPVAAVVVPWVELICGLFLILGLRTRAAASVIALLLIAFNVLIGANVVMGSPINCGCYDTVGEPVSWWKILKNSFWLLFTIQVFFFDRLFLLRPGGVFRKRVADSLPGS